MDREVLSIFLNSGPARKFPVLSFTEKINELARSEREYLFNNPFLNYSILFKCMHLDSDDDFADDKIISTLIYLPYDHQCPRDGGESFFYSEDSLLDFMEYKFGRAACLQSGLEEDIRLLNCLDSIPTFSTLIVDFALKSASLTVPRTYIDLPPDFRRRAETHLKGRFRPLITAAIGSMPVNVEKAVHFMTQKLLCLNSLSDIFPLVKALRLPMDRAQEILQSWIGLTYLEYEYAEIQGELKHLSKWMETSIGKHDNAPAAEKDYMLTMLSLVRAQMKSEWKTVADTFSEYKDSYDDFVFNNSIKRFNEFLVGSEKNYWKVADILGRFDQTALVWKRFEKRLTKANVSLEQMVKFFFVLRRLHMNAR